MGERRLPQREKGLRHFNGSFPLILKTAVSTGPCSASASTSLCRKRASRRRFAPSPVLFSTARAPWRCAAAFRLPSSAAFSRCIRTSGSNAFIESYRSHSFLTGRAITFSLGEETYRGVVTGISDEAHLLVRLDCGEERAFSAARCRSTRALQTRKPNKLLSVPYSEMNRGK